MSAVEEIVDRLIASGMSPAEAACLVIRATADCASASQSRPKGRARSAAADRMHDHRERRVKMGLPRVLDTRPIIPRLIARDGGANCIYCGSDDRVLVDHIVPIFLGGDDDLDNLGLCCKSCNGKKGGRELATTGMEIICESAKVAHVRYCSRNSANNVRHFTPSSSSSPTPPLITPSPISSLRSESDFSNSRANGELFEAQPSAADWPRDAFERFWSIAPRKVGRKAAQRAFDAVRRKRETSWDRLWQAWQRHAEHSRQADPRFVPHPSTWLNEGRWDDEPARNSTGPPKAGGFAAVLEDLGGIHGGSEYSDSDYERR